MATLQPAFVSFLKQLSKNNNTEWFNENRKIYEKDVKKPFNEFVEEMITRIRKHEPAVNIKPADAIMRINKDVRFSKDKTPYNAHMAANISVYGKKDKSFPGFYFQFSPTKIQVVGGAYVLEKEDLQKVRTYISKNLKAFEKAVTAPGFVKKFGSIQGEKNKVLPPEFKALVEKQPLIANKSFYYSAELEADKIVSPKLQDLLMEYYEAAREVNLFLVKALGKSVG